MIVLRCTFKLSLPLQTHNFIICVVVEVKDGPLVCVHTYSVSLNQYQTNTGRIYRIRQMVADKLALKTIVSARPSGWKGWWLGLSANTRIAVSSRTRIVFLMTNELIVLKICTIELYRRRRMYKEIKYIERGGEESRRCAHWLRSRLLFSFCAWIRQSVVHNIIKEQTVRHSVCTFYAFRQSAQSHAIMPCTTRRMP